MSTVLDGLKERLEGAKVRLSAAQQRHQASQLELNAATAEHNVWNAAYTIELREDEKRTAAAQENQMSLPEVQRIELIRVQSIDTNRIQSIDTNPHEQSDGGEAPVNKTDLVRDALRAHATGLTPADLWKALGKHFTSKAYLYSILKRLRDHDEVVLKRSGKYVLKPKHVEAKTEMEVVQSGEAASA
jgi:hypothetical protein